MTHNRHARRAGKTNVLHLHTLDALASIVECREIGPGAQRHTLESHTDAGGVHQLKHDQDALMLLADQLADAVAILAITHRTGRRAMNAELLFQSDAGDVIGRAGLSLRVESEFGNQKQAQPLDSRRRAFETRQHQVNHVVDQIVIAAADEDFLSLDVVVSVALYGAGRDVTDRRSGMRLG